MTPPTTPPRRDSTGRPPPVHRGRPVRRSPVALCRHPSGAPAQGVTTTTITIGYGDDAGYPATPGLGHEAADAVKALIDWCNEQGGINGRTVEGQLLRRQDHQRQQRDDRGLRQQVFFLVGQAWALAGSGEQTRIECGLPTRARLNAGTDLATPAGGVAHPGSRSTTSTSSGAALIAEKFPDEVQKTAIMEPNFPAVHRLRPSGSSGRRTVGWTFLDCTVQIPDHGRERLPALPAAHQGLRRETVFTTDVGSNFQNMLDAAEQLDFHPIWINIPTIYTPALRATGTPAATPTTCYFGNGMVPLDHTPEGSANATYVDLVTAQRRRPRLHRPAGDLGVPAVGHRRQGLRRTTSPGPA